MSKSYVHEFLFRGRPEEGPDAGAPGWHVVIGQYVMMPGETDPQLVTSTAMTPAQAERAGFGLPTILSGIGAAALKSRDEAVTARDAAIEERDAARRERDAMGAEWEAMKAERDAMEAERDAALMRLAETAAPVTEPEAA